MLLDSAIFWRKRITVREDLALKLALQFFCGLMMIGLLSGCGLLSRVFDGTHAASNQAPERDGEQSVASGDGPEPINGSGNSGSTPEAAPSGGSSAASAPQPSPSDTNNADSTSSPSVSGSTVGGPPGDLGNNVGGGGAGVINETKS